MRQVERVVGPEPQHHARCLGLEDPRRASIHIAPRDCHAARISRCSARESRRGRHAESGQHYPSFTVARAGCILGLSSGGENCMTLAAPARDVAAERAAIEADIAGKTLLGAFAETVALL